MRFIKQMKATFLAVLTFLSISLPVVQGKEIDYTTAHLERRMPAIKITGEIKIDGSLDEPEWQKAAIATDFIQKEPAQGEPSTEKTIVRVMYDSKSLYIGAMVYDREPQKLVVNDIKKDYTSTESDAFGIALDTFHDGRNGFQFVTSPRGGKWDAQIFNESVLEANWDGVWYVKTRILDDGWVAEIEIPFKTLKFSNASTQTWGMNFLRRIRRRNEDTHWSPMPRIYAMHQRLSLAGTLENLEGIKPASNIRLKPYVLSSYGQFNEATRTRHDWSRDAGLDVKYGIGSALTLDATLNTDFAQVEADEQQVNLTRFSLFFPEKREFFVENNGIFTFGTREVIGRGASIGATSGRQSGGQGGREDLIFFFSRQIGISSDGQEIPLYGGARLTGRTGPWSLGLLNIQTRKAFSTPSTNFTVARVRRNVLAASQIGGIFINKKEHATGRFNRGYGADANLRFGSSTYVSTFYAKTDSPEIHSQNDSYRFAFAYNDRVWDLRSVYTDIANNFDAQVGFVPRKGIKNWSNYFGIKMRPAWRPRWVREITPSIAPEMFWSQANRLETRYMDGGVTISLQDGGSIDAGRNASFERLFNPFRIQSGVRIPAGDYWFNDYFVGYNASRAAKMGLNLRYQTGDFYSGERDSYTLGATLRLNYHLTASANFTRNDVRLPQANFNTDLLALRFNYAFTTAVFLNALVQRNTDARQWSSNIRFNIIHRPLSDFFLVYNERRDTGSGKLIDRALIGKFTYMIER